jgi:hypothetical protein
MRLPRPAYAQLTGLHGPVGSAAQTALPRPGEPASIVLWFIDRLDWFMATHRRASHRTAGHVSRGLARHGPGGSARQGTAQHGLAVAAWRSVACPGVDRRGPVRQCTAAEVWPGDPWTARHGKAGLGSARQPRLGMASRISASVGSAWPGGTARSAMLGTAGRGRAVKAGQCQPRQGSAGQGCHGSVTRGISRRGAAWPGAAGRRGPARCRHGLALRSGAVRGLAGPEGVGLDWQGLAWRGEAAGAR